MSEAADELERMAEEFEREARIVAIESAAGTFSAGHGAGKAAAASRLRARAAEIRRPNELLAKPEQVETRQWWRFDGGVARLVTGFEERGGDLYTCFDGASEASHPRDSVGEMLSSSDWHYLGNSDHPQNA